MYAIRNHKIYKFEVVKESKRGTAIWGRLNNSSKLYIVSLANIFNTYEDAQKKLK